MAPATKGHGVHTMTTSTHDQCRTLLDALFDAGDVIEFRMVRPETEDARPECWQTMATLNAAAVREAMT